MDKAKQQIGSELINEKQFDGSVSTCATYLTASL